MHRTAVLLTLFSGLLHGKLTNQWGLPPEALAAAETQPDHTVTAQAARYQIGRTAVLSETNFENGVTALSHYLDGPRFGELPDFYWAHYRRGLLHESLQNTEEAQRDFEFAAATDDRHLKRALHSL